MAKTWPKCPPTDTNAIGIPARRKGERNAIRSDQVATMTNIVAVRSQLECKRISRMHLLATIYGGTVSSWLIAAV